MRTPPPDLPSASQGTDRLPGLTAVLGRRCEATDGHRCHRTDHPQLLYLEFDNAEKPIYFLNSTGTSWYSGDAIGFETEAFAIYDTLRYVKPPVHTICIGQAMGTAAVILSAGTKGQRAALPHSSIVLHQPRSGAQGQATDIQIRAKEVLHNKQPCLRSSPTTPAAVLKS